MMSGVSAAAAAPPVINNFGPDVTYTEGADPTLIAPAATVSDADSSHFGGGRLTVSLTGSQSTDDLLIRNQGRGAGQIGLSGTRVLYGGVVIGTASGGRGNTPLVVNFNRYATPTAVQALARNIGFGTLSENPSSQVRDITVTLRDGSGQVSAPATKSIVVAPVNDAPVLNGVGNTVTWSESTGAAVVINPQAQVSDVDSSNFSGGTVTAAVVQNAQAGDTLSIRNQGTGSGQIGVSGATVTYGGVAIGTVTGSGTSSLSVALNSSATPGAVTALLRNITFDNSDANPSALTRRVDIQVSDGDGGTSNTGSSFVKLAAVNNAPVVSNFGPAVTHDRGGDPTFLSTTATVTDADSTNFAGGRLTVRITANGQGSDGFAIYSEGFGPGQIGRSGSTVYYGGVAFGAFSGGTGTTPLVVSFNQNATPAAVQALVRSIGFYTSSSASTASRQISLTISDGDGGTSTAVMKNVLVT
jgi:hypothetical protein